MSSGVQFLRVNPGIESFNSGMNQAGARRRLDQNTEQQDIEFRQAQAVDAALRRGIGDYYATDQGQVNTPAPPGVSAAAQPVAVPAPPPSAEPAISYQTPTASGAGEFGVNPPVAAQAAPAEVSGPSFTPPAVRAAPRQTAYGGMIRQLVRAPGGGRAAMQLHQQDVQGQRTDEQTRRKMQHDGQVMWLKAVNDGDLRMAQHIGQQYGLELPPDIYTNRQTLTDVRVASSLAKTMGISDDQTAVAFVDAYVDARQKGGNEAVALQNARKVISAGAGGVGTAKHWAVDDKGEVTGFDQNGRPIRTGVRARKQEWEVHGPGSGRSGAGGGGSKQQQYAEWRIKTLVASGMLEVEAQRLVSSGSAYKPMTQAQRITAANRLLAQTDRVGRKIYPDLNAALKALDGATSGANAPPADAAAAAPAPAPAAAPAAPAAGGGTQVKRFRFDPNADDLVPQN